MKAKVDELLKDRTLWEERGSTKRLEEAGRQFRREHIKACLRCASYNDAFKA